MHEVAAMQGVVRTILETMRQAGGSRITHVQLVLGASGHFTEEAAHQHFEALTANTSAEGAALSISWIPATFQCFSCLYRFESCQTAEQVSCPRCSDIALQIGHQDTCSVSAIEVTFEESSFDHSVFELSVPFVSTPHSLARKAMRKRVNKRSRRNGGISI